MEAKPLAEEILALLQARGLPHAEVVMRDELDHVVRVQGVKIGKAPDRQVHQVELLFNEDLLERGYRAWFEAYEYVLQDPDLRLDVIEALHERVGLARVDAHLVCEVFLSCWFKDMIHSVER